MSGMLCESIAESSLREQVSEQGFAFVDAARMRALLKTHGGLDDWQEFADSWNRLELDTYMADGGRDRRRRYAVFSAESGGAVERQPHAPHYQTREYNTLNGGVERWFAPVEAAVSGSQSLATILGCARELFEHLSPQTRAWHIEFHQFRIEALSDAPGRPTPEGMHRDGVDYVLVLLVKRCNIRSGTTSIHALDGAELGSFTLTQAFDAALVEDARVFHGVTAVEPVDATLPAFRDVLVATFRAR